MQRPLEILLNTGCLGRITGGQFSGQYLIIDNDREGSTGGYYLYTFKDQEKIDCTGDFWLEHMESVQAQLRHLGITTIDWI